MNDKDKAMVEKLKTFQPLQIIDAYKPLLQVIALGLFPTIDRARDMEDTPQIKHVAFAFGDKVAVNWIQEQLVTMAEYVGVKDTMNNRQLTELAYQIFFTYKYLNLFEFILFCARLRSGRYKEFYGTIDPMAITKSLEMFCDERQEDAQRAYKERQEREREEQRKREEAIPRATHEQIEELKKKYGIKTNPN